MFSYFSKLIFYNFSITFSWTFYLNASPPLLHFPTPFHICLVHSNSLHFPHLLSISGDFLNQSNEGRLSPALSVASSSGYRSYNQEMPGAYDLHQLPPHQPPLPPHHRQPGSSSLPPHPRDTSSPFQPPLASSSTTSSALEDPRRTTPLSHYGQQHHQPIRTSYDETRNSTTPMDVSGGVVFGSARATPVDR